MKSLQVEESYCPICGSEKYPCEHEEIVRRKAALLRDILEELNLKVRPYCGNVLVEDEHGHTEIV